MIYLITGVPGSGKTLYAVSTLLQKLLKEVVKGKDGKETKRRIVVDGIPDLVIEHELMADRPEDGSPPTEGHGLWNWFEWCKPGDILVVDEVQRHWRPRGMGTKPPAEIAKLETHRHLGVDFVVITQSPMLIDQNVRRLVGRHQNVRRIFGGARALIYDWDGCQTDVHRTQGATKTLWSYPKKAFALYKSSELHTKQQQKIPLWMAFPVVVLALGAFAGPKAFSAMQGALSGKGVVQAAPASVAASSAARPVQPAQATPAMPPVAVAASAPVAPANGRGGAEPVTVAGCGVVRGQCRCYGTRGELVEVVRATCDGLRDGGSALALEAGSEQVQGAVSDGSGDAEMVAWMRGISHANRASKVMVGE